MRTLYVMRHAEPAASGVLLGQSDPPLSERGRIDACSLRGYFRDVAVYSSPLLRARETASYITPTPIVLPELAEISYGKWDGLAWSEIEKQWPDLAQQKLDDWEGVISPDGEPWTTFRSRVQRALRLIAKRRLPALVVAHEAVNAVIGKELQGTAIHSYKQKYCEIVQYELPFGE